MKQHELWFWISLTYAFFLQGPFQEDSARSESYFTTQETKKQTNQHYNLY